MNNWSCTEYRADNYNDSKKAAQSNYCARQQNTCPTIAVANINQSLTDNTWEAKD